METIEYRLKFFSDWHCGAGLAAGADLDALVIKDKEGLPYIPGKTIKGLIREALIDLFYLSLDGDVAMIPEDKKSAFELTFGYSKKDETCEGKQGSCFFSNAEIPEEQARAIVNNCAQKYLYRSQASTAIKEDGIADDHSLRKMETVIPCELKGSIMNIDERIVEEVKQALKMIKRMGVKRNRGLGRCQFIIPAEERRII